jgi:hypothetical protein
MKSKLITPQFIFVSSAVFIAALSRLLPHIDNFTPIAAIALFGGAYFSDKKFAFVIPLLAMFISDLALQLMFGWGFHTTIIYVYAAFALTTVIGLIIKRNLTIKSVVIGSLTSSVFFFIITNFGYWASTGFQSGVTGLNAAYVSGLPFFRATMLGDLFYNAVLFGSFYLAQSKIPAFAKMK